MFEHQDDGREFGRKRAKDLDGRRRYSAECEVVKNME